MKKIIAGALFFAPALAFAQAFEGVQDWVEGIADIVGLLIPIAAALALLYFFWGLAKFVLASGDEEAREKGKNIMIAGIISLFVIASIWGIVQFLGNQLNIDSGARDVSVPGFREI